VMPANVVVVNGDAEFHVPDSKMPALMEALIGFWENDSAKTMLTAHIEAEKAQEKPNEALHGAIPKEADRG